MNAYDVMHEWDRSTGRPDRSNEQLDRDIPPLLKNRDYETWKAALESGNIPAIREGMTLWGMPIEPLPAFEIDDAIATYERTMEVLQPGAPNGNNGDL